MHRLLIFVLDILIRDICILYYERINFIYGGIYYEKVNGQIF